MMQRTLVVLLFASCTTAPAQSDNATIFSATARIKELGGKIQRHATPSGHPVFSIDLGGTPLVEADLAWLGKLETLTLALTGVRDDQLVEFAELPGLTTLSLAGNAISDDAMETLAQLANLRTINLSFTRVSPQGIRQLQASRPDLTIRHSRM